MSAGYICTIELEYQRPECEYVGCDIINEITNQVNQQGNNIPLLHNTRMLKSSRTCYKAITHKLVSQSKRLHKEIIV